MEEYNPYAASPSSLPPPLHAGPDHGSNLLEPTGSFVTGIKIFMIIQIAALLGINLSDTLGNVLIPGYSDPAGNFDLSGPAIPILAVLVLSFLAYLGSFITVIVLVCRFMSRANRNVRRLGASHLSFTPGWCSGWWFIPFANLVQPYRCMKELWLTSETAEGYHWTRNTPPGFIGIWWACWIVGNILSSLEARIALFMDVGPGTMMIGWISTILLIAAGLLLIKIVRGIHNHQTGQALA